MNNKKYIFLFIMLLQFVSSSLAQNNFDDPLQVLANNGFDKKNLVDLSITSHQIRHQKGSLEIFHTFLLKNKSGSTTYTLEMIENLEENKGIGLVQKYSKSAINSFMNRKSPYAGETTTTIVCPEEFRPLTEEINYFSTRSYVLLVNASERNTLGVCDKSLISKKAILFIAFNPKTKIFFNMRIFIPMKNFNNDFYLNFLNQFHKPML